MLLVFEIQVKDPKQLVETLKENLSLNFELVDTLDVPFVIKETARKYQHTISQMSIWKRK